jgi:hypothetical protein
MRDFEIQNGALGVDMTARACRRSHMIQISVLVD